MVDILDSVFPEWGVAGLPGGDATRFLRVDFRLEGGDKYSSFDSLIETKCPRLVWARAMLCPCKGYNDQTQQNDPNCPKCNASGWTYFTPKEYVVDAESLGELDDMQEALRTKANGVIIRGLFTNMTSEPSMFQALGPTAFGSAMLTVRAANRLGYFDRIVQIDEVAPYSEVVKVSGNTLATRYPVRWLNYCSSIDTAYGDNELTLYKDGVLEWKEGLAPTDGTRVSVHYMHHPTWLLVEYANLVRTSLVKFRKPAPQTPDPAEITGPATAPRRGWWRRG